MGNGNSSEKTIGVVVTLVLVRVVRVQMT